jgi:uncharacterized protein YndB with AHSA1/START domain
MAEDPRITRTVETELTPDELWSLVADGEGWASWLVDDADIVVEPGATGTVVDDDEVRDVRIDRVEPHERVAFTWWPQGRTEQATRVELVVVPGRLLISETKNAAPVASAAIRWDVRALVLSSLALAARA